MKTRHNGFTLIEMLVVIAIIGILASMMFPAILGAIGGAKKNKARQECMSIANAVSLYFNDYNKLPIASQPLADDGVDTYNTDAYAQEIIQALTANDTALNPKEKPYLQIDNASPDGVYLDPWKMQYRVLLDRNFDGKILYAGSTNLTRVIVVSGGPDKDVSTTVDNLASMRLD